MIVNCNGLYFLKAEICNEMRCIEPSYNAILVKWATGGKLNEIAYRRNLI